MGHQMKMYITLVRNDLEQQCMHVVNTLQNFLLLVKAAVTEKKKTLPSGGKNVQQSQCPGKISNVT